MLASYYVRLFLKAVTESAVRDAYCDWVLGGGRSDRLRHRRIQVGIDAGWTREQLVGGATLRGRYGCTMDARVGTGQFLLQLAHHDADQPAVFWHNTVRISRGEPGTIVEHAVGRTAPRDVYLEPVAGPPSIIASLIELNGPDLVPSEIQDASRALMGQDDAVLLADYLLAPQRVVPLLVLSAARFPEESFDGTVAARSLVGMARVVRLADDAAASAFTRRLVALGLDEKLGLWDGAARLYRTGATSKDSPYHHPLWTRSRMEKVEPSGRERRLAGEVARILVRERLPPGFFDLIAREDANARQVIAERLLAERQAATAAHKKTEAEATAHIAERELRVSALESALAAAQKNWDAWCKDYEQHERRHKELEERLDEREEQVRDLEDELRRKSTYQEQLTKTCDDLRREVLQVRVEPVVREAIVGAVIREPSPEQALLLIAALFPERVVVLREAMMSARRAAAFRKGRKLFDLLLKLVGPYFDAVRSGHGDGIAGQVFGASFAAVESELTTRSPAARAARTRELDGAELVMWRHLKIGVKESAAECIRVHFDWSPRRDRLVIGHCGEHLCIAGA
jgi:hypothetical protein